MNYRLLLGWNKDAKIEIETANLSSLSGSFARIRRIVPLETVVRTPARFGRTAQRFALTSLVIVAFAALVAARFFLA